MSRPAALAWQAAGRGAWIKQSEAHIACLRDMAVSLAQFMMVEGGARGFISGKPARFSRDKPQGRARSQRRFRPGDSQSLLAETGAASEVRGGPRRSAVPTRRRTNVLCLVGRRAAGRDGGPAGAEDFAGETRRVFAVKPQAGAWAMRQQWTCWIAGSLTRSN